MEKIGGNIDRCVNELDAINDWLSLYGVELNVCIVILFYKTPSINTSLTP